MSHRTNRSPRRGAWWTLIALAAVLAPGVARAQGISIALSPPEQSVALGATFDLEIRVVQPGSLFNGFEAVVTYDPDALTFIPGVPVSSQQGCLMTGGCSAACGNTFHIFTPSAGSLSITDILLCDQIALTGPGQIYKLRFKASNIAQVTWVRFSSCVFYNAGFYVNPVTRADAAIGIGVVLGVGGPGLASAGLRVSARPNPARREVNLAIETGAEGPQELAVHDVTGRMVRRLPSGWFGAGRHQVRWDGRDDAGLLVPSGTYLVTVRDRIGIAHTRVTLLR